VVSAGGNEKDRDSAPAYFTYTKSAPQVLGKAVRGCLPLLGTKSNGQSRFRKIRSRGYFEGAFGWLRGRKSVFCVRVAGAGELRTGAFSGVPVFWKRGDGHHHQRWSLLVYPANHGSQGGSPCSGPSLGRVTWCELPRHAQATRASFCVRPA
jgi:hypothetical protein